MLTKSGAKLLDFGLAKLRQPVAAASLPGDALVQSSADRNGHRARHLRLHGARTDRGQAADARADIFALGALLYEMATGRRAFDGDSQAALTASILAHHPPPASSVEPSLPMISIIW